MRSSGHTSTGTGGLCTEVPTFDIYQPGLLQPYARRLRRIPTSPVSADEKRTSDDGSGAAADIGTMPEGPILLVIPVAVL